MTIDTTALSLHLFFIDDWLFVIIFTCDFCFFTETNDMEVPNQSNNTVVESEVSNNTSTNNQLNSTEYVVPSTRQRAQQQQQLLLVKKNSI